MIHAGLVEHLWDYGPLIRVVDEEPGMTGNSLRLSAVVIDFKRGRLQAGGDVHRPALARRSQCARGLENDPASTRRTNARAGPADSQDPPSHPGGINRGDHQPV